MTTRKKDGETPAAIVAIDEGSSFDDYAQQAELPPYAAPIQPSYSFPLLQYGKKVNVVSGRKPSAYTGFLIGIEQDATLDDLFEQGGVPQVRIRHRNGTEDSYWQFDSIKGYILCHAVPIEYGPDAWQRTGVAYVWNEHHGTYAYGSQLQCLFFVKGLLELGYAQPLILTLSRTITEHFIAKVFRRHEAMLQVISKALKRQDKPHDLAFYAYWIELVKSLEEVTVKNGGTYFPLVTTIPAPLTVPFVKEHETPAEHLEIIESFLPILLPWAQAASAQLLLPPRDNGSSAAQEPEPPAE